MKNKSIKKTSYTAAIDSTNKVNEPIANYYTNVKVIPSVKLLKEFTYNNFKKIASKVSFTQSEWSAILHISERTLQRYAKNNSSFAFINAERALKIDVVLNRAVEVFGDTEKFYHWLMRNPATLDGDLSFNSLTTYDGIEKILLQIGRIEHGIFA